MSITEIENVIGHSARVKKIQVQRASFSDRDSDSSVGKCRRCLWAKDQKGGNMLQRKRLPATIKFIKNKS